MHSDPSLCCLHGDFMDLGIPLKDNELFFFFSYLAEAQPHGES